MKYFVLIVVSMLMWMGGEAKMVSDNLINALVQVETGGRNDLIGSCGEVGILQILQPCITDVNRVYKKKYTLSDAKNPVKAREICRLYLTYYGKYYERKTGKKVTDEILSKIWNGGPMAWKKKTGKVAVNLATYWHKVRKELYA